MGRSWISFGDVIWKVSSYCSGPRGDDQQTETVHGQGGVTPVGVR